MAKLSPDARRIRTIIIATPFLIASSILMYKRLVLGEEQKLIPRGPPPGLVEAIKAEAAERERKKGL